MVVVVVVLVVGYKNLYLYDGSSMSVISNMVVVGLQSLTKRFHQVRTCLKSPKNSIRAFMSNYYKARSSKAIIVVRKNHGPRFPA